MRQKYGNKKYMVMGFRFDSKAEGEYYLYLLGEKKAGRVKRIVLQPKIELQPKFICDGKIINPIFYIADFYVEYMDGCREYIDVKGIATTEAEMKRKMYLYQNPAGIPLRWVAKSCDYSNEPYMDYFEKQKLVRKKQRLAR